MKSTVENLSPTRVKIAVEVPFEEIQSSLDAAYKSIGQQVKIPGFRPGKIPARVIDQRIGRAAVLEQAVNDALPKAYEDAVRETGVKAIGQLFHAHQLRSARALRVASRCAARGADR